MTPEEKLEWEARSKEYSRRRMQAHRKWQAVCSSFSHPKISIKIRFCWKFQKALSEIWMSFKNFLFFDSCFSIFNGFDKPLILHTHKIKNQSVGLNDSKFKDLVYLSLYDSMTFDTRNSKQSVLRFVWPLPKGCKLSVTKLGIIYVWIGRSRQSWDVGIDRET